MPLFRVKTGAILLCLAGAGTLRADLARFQYTEVHMGMQARIVIYAASEVEAQAGARAAFRRIEELDSILSDYRVSSDLRRLCDRAGTGPVRVHRDLFRLLSLAQEISEKTNGAFDVTVGPLVQLWRQARCSGKLPDAADIRSARALVGWRNVVVRKADGTVELKLPGMRLDLGGIAKGYACQEALKVLHRRGLHMGMVEIGGDLALGHAPPNKKGWAVEIPFAPRPKDRLRHLRDTCVSTSGDTQQFVEIGGVRYSHIVDPSTGVGLTNRLGVTVIAREGWLADALSTAICVLGEEEGRRLASSYRGVEVFIQRAE